MRCRLAASPSNHEFAAESDTDDDDELAPAPGNTLQQSGLAYNTPTRVPRLSMDFSMTSRTACFYGKWMCKKSEFVWLKI